jgi:hypothetical protein
MEPAAVEAGRAGDGVLLAADLPGFARIGLRYRGDVVHA